MMSLFQNIVMGDVVDTKQVPVDLYMYFAGIFSANVKSFLYLFGEMRISFGHNNCFLLIYSAK